MITEYPFIKHIPVVIVMSISHISNCARMYQKHDSTNATRLYGSGSVSHLIWSGKQLAISVGWFPAWR